MSSIPGKNRGGKRDFWYRMEFDAMLEISQLMEPEDFGFLCALINLMHRHGGGVIDDGTYITKFVKGRNARGWRQVRERLLAGGHIYVEGSILRSKIVDDERAEAEGRRQNGGMNRQLNHHINNQFRPEKPNENNDPLHTVTATAIEEKIGRQNRIDIGERAPAGPKSSPAKESSEQVTEENLSPSPTPNSETSENGKFVPRGPHSLPDDWAPSAGNISYALDKGWARDVVLLEAERFINYHRMHDKRFKDWNLVWRNWVVSPYFGASSKNERSGKLTVQEAARNLHERVTARARELRDGVGDGDVNNVVRLLPSGRC
jgi:hypothetical protein